MLLFITLIMFHKLNKYFNSSSFPALWGSGSTFSFCTGCYKLCRPPSHSFLLHRVHAQVLQFFFMLHGVKSCYLLDTTFMCKISLSWKCFLRNHLQTPVVVWPAWRQCTPLSCRHLSSTLLHTARVYSTTHWQPSLTAGSCWCCIRLKSLDFHPRFLLSSHALAILYMSLFFGTLMKTLPFIWLNSNHSHLVEVILDPNSVV